MIPLSGAVLRVFLWNGASLLAVPTVRRSLSVLLALLQHQLEGSAFCLTLNKLSFLSKTELNI